ncbi:MAG: HAD-IA family hydrolase [Verrucomicrobiae bacterium]
MKRLARFVMRGGRRRVGAAGSLGVRPKLVIFDFDGTLADTFQCAVEILNVMAPAFGYRPLAETDVPRARDMSTGGVMKFLGISATRLPKISRRGKEEMNKRMPDVGPLPGMIELVRRLKAEGFRLGILTSNSEENVATFLRKFHLEGFEFIHTSSKLSGKGRIIRKILKRLRLKPKEVLLVGDEVRDIEAAQDTGVHMAAVSWGYNSHKALAAGHPDHLVETPSALAELICGLPGTPG